MRRQINVSTFGTRPEMFWVAVLGVYRLAPLQHATGFFERIKCKVNFDENLNSERNDELGNGSACAPPYTQINWTEESEKCLDYHTNCVRFIRVRQSITRICYLSVLLSFLISCLPTINNSYQKTKLVHVNKMGIFSGNIATIVLRGELLLLTLISSCSILFVSCFLVSTGRLIY